MNSFENLPVYTLNVGAYATCSYRHVLLSVLLLSGAQFEALYKLDRVECTTCAVLHGGEGDLKLVYG